MKILSERIKKADLFTNADVVFDGDMVKGVIDINKKIVAVDAELHADLEQLLLENGSRQEDLWGVNFWQGPDDDFVEFDSMINIRPRQNNRSRYVEDETTREKITEVINKWIQ